MTGDGDTWFLNATGVDITSPHALFFGIMAAGILAWAIYTIMGTYRQYEDGTLKLNELVSNSVQIIIITAMWIYVATAL